MKVFKEKTLKIILIIIAAAAFVCCTFFCLQTPGDRPEMVLGEAEMTPHWDERSIYYFEDLLLDKGTYTVEVSYETTYDLQIQMIAVNSYQYKIHSTPVRLDTGEKGRESFRIMVEQDNTPCYLKISEQEPHEGYSPASFQIRIVYRPGLTAAYRVLSVLFFFFLAACIAVCAVFFKTESSMEKKTVMLVLLALFLFTALPTMAEYVGEPTGQGDADFHMLRIAHLSDAMFEYGFQTRLQPGWHRDYGYPVAVYYGETLLVPPAVLYRLGVPIWQCYQFYLGGVFLLAVVLSFYAFYCISERSDMALAGSALYMTSVRLLCVAYRFSALGEIAAMAFLPLAASGLCLLLRKDMQRKGTVCLVVAFSGMLQTHVITVTRAALFAAVFFVFEHRQLLKKEVLRPLLKGIGAALLLNAWFLVPFADYFLRHDFGRNMNNIGRYALEPLKLFVTGEGYMGIGTALTLFLVLGLFFFATGRTRKETKYHLTVLMCLLFAALFFTSSLMPYKKLMELAPPVYAVLGAGIEHAWRYASMATVLVIVFGLCVLRDVWQNGEQKELRTAVLLTLGITIVSVVQGGMLMVDSRLPNSVKQMKELDAASLDTRGGGSYDYLLDGFAEGYAGGYDEWVRGPVERNVRAEGTGTMLSDVTRNGMSFRLYAENAQGEDASVVFPVWNYAGYVAEGEGQRLAVSDGPGRTVSVTVPAGFDGELSLDYHEPGYWKAADVISLAGLIAFCVPLIRSMWKKRGGAVS